MAAAIVLFFVFHVGQYLTLDALNANRGRLQSAVEEAPVQAAVIFGLAYVAVTALSLPVATAMTLLAGALFGRVQGTALVDVSATVGATLAFLAVRYVLRDWVERRFTSPPDPAWGPDDWRTRSAHRRRAAWAAVSNGIRENGFNYLLVLRLLPIAPFFLINLVAGLTAMPLRAFALGTLAGILPGSFLYVNAGAALGTLSRPTDLLSWRVLGALGLLALFSLVPVVWRYLHSRKRGAA
jgi:uncharacterized membrane protein YdjX (TVP38/TMEM64 family)